MTTDCETVIEDYHTIIGTYFGIAAAQEQYYVLT